MKRKTSSIPTKIYSYGCLGPATNPEIVDQQLFLARKYRNNLIEIELARRASVRTALLLPESVAPFAASVSSLEKSVSDARIEIQAAKVTSKTRNPTSTDATLAKARLKVLLPQLKDARAALKDAKKAGMVDEQVKASLAQSDDVAKLAVKAARAQCGLYWGTYLLVEKTAEQFRKSVRDPKFRKWDGSGRLGVQFQHGITIDRMFSGADTRIRIEHMDDETWEQARKNKPKFSRVFRTLVHIRIESTDSREPIWAAFPLFYSRPLPPDGLVKWAWIRRTRVGRRPRYELQVMVESASFATRLSGKPAVAIDIGWRSKDGSLRVAWLHDEEGNTEEIQFPEGAIRYFQKPDELRAIRDRMFNEKKAELKKALGGEAEPASGLGTEAGDNMRTRAPGTPDEKSKSITRARAPGIRKEPEKVNSTDAKHARAPGTREASAIPGWFVQECKHLHLWKVPQHLAKLVRRWRDERWEGDEELFASMLAWYKQENHLYDWESNGRDQVVAWRKDFYRKLARRIADRWGVVVLEDFDLRKIAKLPRPEEKDDTPDLARQYRFRASLSEFRQILLSTCAGSCEIVKVPAQNTTMMCNSCGYSKPWDAAPKIDHTCEGCGKTWDQDENAAKNILERWRSGKEGAKKAA